MLAVAQQRVEQDALEHHEQLALGAALAVLEAKVHAAGPLCRGAQHVLDEIGMHSRTPHEQALQLRTYFAQEAACLGTARVIVRSVEHAQQASIGGARRADLVATLLPAVM